jgi:hypothetical protein
MEFAATSAAVPPPSRPRSSFLMKKIALFVAFIVVLCLAGSTNGQSKQKPQDPDGRNPAIVVIGSAAKVGWATTRFAGRKDIAGQRRAKGGEIHAQEQRLRC